MASIKVKFRPSTVAGKEGSVYYQIIHERVVRQFLTQYKVLASEWNEKRAIPLVRSDSGRATMVRLIREHIRWDVERFTRILRNFELKGIIYSADDIVEEFELYNNKYSLFNYTQSLIATLRLRNKTRTAETYAAALNSFKKFRAGNDIMLDNLTSDVIEAYEAYLRAGGLTLNTSSFYIRILRAVYNRAVDNDIIDQRHPFRHVYTGVEKTVKRALPIPIIKKIKALDLTFQPNIEYARDMFLMSFYFRGMSFIDMAYLRKSDLKNGYLTYRRRKTGQMLIIGWTREMQDIIDKYPPNPTQYLLPIITNPIASERHAYRNAGYHINYHLKQIAMMVGLTMPLSMYCARHSWASAAKSKGVPLSVISEGMGHDSKATTKIYLASLDTSVVDKANALIIKSI